MFFYLWGSLSAHCLGAGSMRRIFFATSNGIIKICLLTYAGDASTAIYPGTGYRFSRDRRGLGQPLHLYMRQVREGVTVSVHQKRGGGGGGGDISC
jgi:hypothetical protein